MRKQIAQENLDIGVDAIVLSGGFKWPEGLIPLTYNFGHVVDDLVGHAKDLQREGDKITAEIVLISRFEVLRKDLEESFGCSVACTQLQTRDGIPYERWDGPVEYASATIREVTWTQGVPWAGKA